MSDGKRFKKIRLEGNLVFSAPLAKQKIKEASDRQFVSLDFSDVDYIDSVGVGIILELANKLRAKEGALRLVAVRPGIADILRSAGVDKITEMTAENLPEA